MKEQKCHNSTSDTEMPFCGKMIEPLELVGNEQIADMIDNVFLRSGFNARRLGQAARLFSKMIDSGATIALTLAGAMTPIGMSGPIIELIKRGYIDFIISTGANLYHDLHRPFDYPMMQGSADVDDDELAKERIARIYDVFIHDDETLTATDKVILQAISEFDQSDRISTAQLHYNLGKTVAKIAQHPEKSLLVTAAEYDVPIYTSSPGDSSIAMNLALCHIWDKPIFIDPLLDVLETTAIVRSSEQNGAVEIGGGSPKNFYMQTQPMLWQILRDPKHSGGHDYFIQLTTDSPHWGGLSGATPQEAKSWGKLKTDDVNHMVVYSCASITFPLISQYVLSKNKPRKHKRLYLKRDEMMQDMKQATKSNPIAIKEWKEITKDCLNNR